MRRQLAVAQELLELELLTEEQVEKYRLHLSDMEEKTEETTDQMVLFFEEAAKEIQQSLADFLFDPFSDGMDGMLNKFSEMVRRMAAEMAAAELLNQVGTAGSGQSGLMGAISTGLKFMASGAGSFSQGAGVSADLDATVFASGSGLFADGGVMTSSGPMQLNRYARGGVATRPQVALFGEGSMNEAFVPLPDGRRIPVAMNDAGGTVVNMTVNTPDASSFRQSKGRIITDIKRSLQ